MDGHYQAAFLLLLDDSGAGGGGGGGIPLPDDVAAKTVSNYIYEDPYIVKNTPTHIINVKDQKGSNDFNDSNVGLVTVPPIERTGGGKLSPGDPDQTAIAQIHTKPFEFLHKGGSWYIAFVFQKDSVTSDWVTLQTCDGTNNTIGIQILIFPNQTFGVNVRVCSEFGSFANVLSTAWVATLDNVHAFLVNYDSTLGSNNLQGFIDNGAASNSGGNTTPNLPFSSGVSALDPKMLGTNLSAGTKDFLGQVLIGNNSLNASEQASLFKYLQKRYKRLPTINMAGRSTMLALGDSITIGYPVAPADQWVTKLATFYSLAVTNIAQSGKGVWNQVNAFQTQAFTPSTVLITCDVGLNDAVRQLGLTRLYNKIQAGHRSIMVRAIANALTPSGHATVTRSLGTFAGFAANTVGGTYPSGSVPGNFATSSSSANAKWSWGFTGTAFGVQFIANSGDVETYGKVVIKVDGVALKVVDLNAGWYDNVFDGSYDNRRGPLAYSFHGLTAGAHTVEVIGDGSGIVPIDFFCTILAPSVAPAIMYLQPTRMTAGGYALGNATDANLTEIGNVVEAVALEYQQLGFNVGVGRTMDWFDVPTGVGPDGVHPNETGYNQIYIGARKTIR